MHFLKKALAIVSFGLIAAGAMAAAAEPQNGVDYLTLDKSQPTDAVGKKVEVLEFFGYFCPHCNAFEPMLANWVKKQGDNIIFKRVPIAFDERMVPQQRLYYTLEALGKVDEMHAKVFHAIHNEHQRLLTEAEITAFATTKLGIDKKTFADTYNSFAVQTKAKRAMQLQSAYKIDGVPTLAVDGRYLTSPSIVGTKQNAPEAVLQENSLKVMDALVAKAARERKSAK